MTCLRFDMCEAPICPLELSDDSMWYIDEEICKLKGMGDNPIVKMQKKITRKTVDESRYFTIQMLQRNCIVGKGMVGLDPDKSEEPQLKVWFKRHPRKREYTKKEKLQFKERVRPIPKQVNP